MKLAMMSRVALLGVAAMLASCGGGGGGAESPAPSPVVSATPPHAAPSFALTEANTRFLLSNAQALQQVFRGWLRQVNLEMSLVGPANPSRSFLCGRGSMEVHYLDLDKDKAWSAGDKIVAESPECSASDLGGGTTSLTALVADKAGLKDARVEQSRGQQAYWAYGWSYRLAGKLRFVYLDGGRILVLSEGDLEVTLAGGQVLLMRNLAITFKTQEETTAGQFDLIFSTGREAGASIQVDTLGELRTSGANVGPEPGLLQLSGLNGTKVQLAGRYESGVGGRFKVSADFAGSGKFTELTDVDDEEFYRWFNQ
ncbi:hypothetical protein [Roseateles sp. P5_D6]